MKLGICSTVAIRPAASVIVVLTIGTVIDGMVDAKMPNRPVEGVLESGYVFPKWLPHPFRTSPGRYWLAYFLWAVGFVIRCVYHEKSRGSRDHFRRYIFGARIGDALAGLALVVSSIISQTIAEVSVIYLAGLCYIQTYVEASRADGRIEESHTYNCYHKIITIWVYSWALMATTVLQTSFDRLEILSAACISANFVIIAPFAASSNFGGESRVEGNDREEGFWRFLDLVNRCKHMFGYKEDPQLPRLLAKFWSEIKSMFGLKEVPQEGRTQPVYNKGNRKWHGLVASLCQLGFCTWSFWLTYQIDDVPRAVTITFFVTTVVIFCGSNFLRFKRGLEV